MPVEIWNASANLLVTAFRRIGVEANLLEEGGGRFMRILNLGSAVFEMSCVTTQSVITTVQQMAQHLVCSQTYYHVYLCVHMPVHFNLFVYLIYSNPGSRHKNSCRPAEICCTAVSRAKRPHNSPGPAHSTSGVRPQTPLLSTSCFNHTNDEKCGSWNPPFDSP